MSHSSASAVPHPGDAPDPSWQRDVRTIGLIGLAHGSSHFFHLLLPPLFPALIHEFGFSYSELGLLVTVFFIISGVGQALSGFLVDKVGARPVRMWRCCALRLPAWRRGLPRGTAVCCWPRRWRGWATRRFTRRTSPS
jgi:MFS family permease